MRTLPWFLFAAAALAILVSWSDLPVAGKGDRVALLLCFAAQLGAQALPFGTPRGTALVEARGDPRTHPAQHEQGQREGYHHTHREGDQERHVEQHEKRGDRGDHAEPRQDVQRHITTKVHDYPGYALGSAGSNAASEVLGLPSKRVDRTTVVRVRATPAIRRSRPRARSRSSTVATRTFTMNDSSPATR